MTALMNEKDLTDDGFLGGRVNLLQPAKGYRAGLDAVLLAASIPARTGERILEAGLGVGVASICLAARVAGLEIIGVELREEIAELARQNAARNQMEEVLTVCEADIGLPVRDFMAMGLEPNSFDHVFSNPPYHDPAAAAASPDDGKAQAHLTLGSDLDDWVRFACVMAKPKGTVTFVHRADALPRLLQAMTGHLGGIEVFPLWPAQDKPASRVIIRGRRGSKSPLTLRQGLVLHGRDGRFTDRAEAILREGASLLLDQAA
ncbi:MAG: methyltransferase [Rhizobiales bacterium]|nr:methyltransferase [Hyphomicrobiales bacterium]